MIEIERLRAAHAAANATNTLFSIRTEDGDEAAAAAISEFYGLAMSAMPMLLDAAAQAVPVDPQACAGIEAEMTRFMRERIENMQISADEIPLRLSRYGLMPPSEFLAEMRERMASARGDDEQEIDREALADSLFEHYDFGDGVQVLSHDRWDSSDPDDWVKRVYVCYEDDAPEDDSHLVSFHVRFSNGGASQEAYALECDGGQQIGRQVTPCVRVEYDLAYWGGDYAGVGKFIYIPMALVDSMRGATTEDDLVDMASRKLTHQDSAHIIHYSLDELYDQDGEPIGHKSAGASSERSS